MADQGNVAALKAAILAVLNNAVADESIEPDDHNTLLDDLLDTITGLDKVLRHNAETGGYSLTVTAGDLIRLADSGFLGDIDTATLTADQTYTFQDATGTVAFLSDIGAGVTNLSEGASTTTTVDVDSDTGTNATIQPASTIRAGVMSSAKFDEVVLNNAKVTNVSTDLSEGASTTTTVDVDSSDGTNATLLAASTLRAGLMSKAKFDEVEVNNAKISDINHNVTTNLSEGTSTTTTVDVNSSDGTNATLAEASTLRAGVLSKAKFDEIVVNNAKVSDINHNATHTSEVTGATALTIDKIAITNKTLVTAALGDKVLISDFSDSDNLKYVDAGDFLSAPDTNLGNTNLTVTATRTVTMGGNAVNFNGGHLKSDTMVYVSDQAFVPSGTYRMWVHGNANTTGGIARFMGRLSTAAKLDIANTGAGFNMDYQSNVGLVVAAHSNTIQARSFTLYDVNKTTERASFTTAGKLGLGAWGAGRLTAALAGSAGWFNVPAGTTDHPQLYLEEGVAPTAPIDGAEWLTTAHRAFRVNSQTIKLYQETTGVTAAAFVANTSGIADDTATFGGYTGGQIVAALKLHGLLA